MKLSAFGVSCFAAAGGAAAGALATAAGAGALAPGKVCVVVATIFCTGSFFCLMVIFRPSSSMVISRWRFY
jgi:hypothetical protein